jgi:3-hydroxyisobutyrate dehydrogenase-like beta-hydroxyacid dehydrogenase
MRIAFLGLGKMGAAIARHLLEKHDLTVWNRSPEAAEPLREAGAEVAKEAAEAVEGAEAVFSALLNDEAISDVFYSGGALQAIPTGAVHACLSTISVALSRKLAHDHESQQKQFVGAPVFGRPHVAEQARLWSALGGSDEAIRKIRPLVERYSRGMTVVSPQPWSAHAMKLGGNFMITAMIASLTEGFVYAAAQGIDPEVYFQVVNQGLFQSPFYELYGKLMLHPPEKAGGTISLGEKDTRLFLEAAGQVHVKTPLAALFHQHLLKAMEEGMKDKDWAAGYYELAQRLSGEEA